MTAQRGSVSVEMVIVAPALLLLFSLALFAGRVALAGQAVQAAAFEAAREASIARQVGPAQAAATAAANRTLAQDGLRCSPSQVTVTTSGFDTPPGEPGSVTARVSCRVSMADLALPGIPGERLMTATATSPIDTYRSRAG